MNTIQLLYFGRLREQFGYNQEHIPLDHPILVDDLLQQLQARGGVWAEELASGKAYRIAVNQQVAQLTTPIKPGAEIAIFPPVTGG